MNIFSKRETHDVDGIVEPIPKRLSNPPPKNVSKQSIGVGIAAQLPTTSIAKKDRESDTEEDRIAPNLLPEDSAKDLKGERLAAFNSMWYVKAERIGAGKRDVKGTRLSSAGESSRTLDV